jgi:hypothetical protein
MLRAVFSHLLIPASLVVEPCDFVATLGIAHTLFRVRRAQSQISRARDYGLSRPCAMYTCESRTTVAQSGRASRFAAGATITETACVTTAIEYRRMRLTSLLRLAGFIVVRAARGFERAHRAFQLRPAIWGPKRANYVWSV